ncbi:MAG TPA: hypothetical protein VGH28_09400 [Polyangiaceae bacterium]|jgi:hypothetical protein
MKAWLPLVAAALGVSLAECNKQEVAPQAREVPAPTFKAPPPHDTVCSVSVEQPPFVVGVGGDNEGICFAPPAPNPHPSANCGPAPGRESPCSDRRPWKPNVRAVVRSRQRARSQIEASLRDALAKILPCATGGWTHRVELAVDASGKVTSKSSVACVAEAFDAMKLPGPDSIVIDLTSS